MGLDGKKTALLLASTLTVMSGAAIAPALPKMAVAFASEPDAAFWTKLILTMPAIFIALFSPVAGWLIDRYGKLKILFLALLLYAVAGTAGLYLNGIPHLLISRAFLGIAVAVIMTTAITLIGDYYEGEERTGFLGIQGTFMALGGTLFVSASGLLAEWGWRYPFYIYFLSIIVIGLSGWYLEEPDKKRYTKAENNLNILKGQWGKIILVYFTIFFGMILFYLVPVQYPFLMDSLGVQSSSLISLGLVLLTIAAAIASAKYQAIKKRISFEKVFVLVFGMVALGFFIVASSTHIAVIMLGLVFSGFGAGLLMPNANLCLIMIAPASVRGKVIGGLTSAVFFGQFFSPVLIQPLMKVTTFQGVFAYAAGGGLLVVLLFLLVFGRVLTTSKVR